MPAPGDGFNGVRRQFESELRNAHAITSITKSYLLPRMLPVRHDQYVLPPECPVLVHT